MQYHAVPTYVSFTIALLKDGSIDMSYDNLNEIASANYTAGLQNFTDRDYFQMIRWCPKLFGIILSQEYIHLPVI